MRTIALQLPEDARAGRDLHDGQDDRGRRKPRLSGDRRGEDGRDDVRVRRADACQHGIDAEPTGYDRRVSEAMAAARRSSSALLFVVVSASAFTLAKLHLAKPGAAQVRVGQARGLLPGRDRLLDDLLGLPRRQGSGRHRPEARRRVHLARGREGADRQRRRRDAGQPRTGGEEEDVLAYLSTIFAPSGNPSSARCSG